MTSFAHVQNFCTHTHLETKRIIGSNDTEMILTYYMHINAGDGANCECEGVTNEFVGAMGFDE